MTATAATTGLNVDGTTIKPLLSTSNLKLWFYLSFKKQKHPEVGSF